MLLNDCNIQGILLIQCYAAINQKLKIEVDIDLQLNYSYFAVLDESWITQ